jgi:hypothetical protein
MTITSTDALHEQLSAVPGVDQIYPSPGLFAHAAAAAGLAAPGYLATRERDGVATSELAIGIDGTATAPEVGLTVGRLLAGQLLSPATTAIVIRIVSVG